MQVAGIDLAWGTRTLTGVAVTDENGALLRSASVRSDSEIAEFLEGSAPAVIAIDAPIIVTNATGMRECERELSRHFRKFHAGTHPTNSSQPSMQPEPRARRLVDAHGWTTDHTSPPSSKTPVALEVYPHSSMVGLFGLDRVIAYKAKSGRTPEMRRTEFTRLMQLMESRCDRSLHLSSSARWLELKATALSAHRHSQLNAIEDEIDAIFCAYVAWAFATASDTLVPYGTAKTGIIMTFPPPS